MDRTYAEALLTLPSSQVPSTFLETLVVLAKRGELEAVIAWVRSNGANAT